MSMIRGGFSSSLLIWISFALSLCFSPWASAFPSTGVLYALSLAPSSGFGAPSAMETEVGQCGQGRQTETEGTQRRRARGAMVRVRLRVVTGVDVTQAAE
jgi:hypothetical protein